MDNHCSYSVVREWSRHWAAASFGPDGASQEIVELVAALHKMVQVQMIGQVGTEMAGSPMRTMLYALDTVCKTERA